MGNKHSRSTTAVAVTSSDPQLQNQSRTHDPKVIENGALFSKKEFRLLERLLPDFNDLQHFSTKQDQFIILQHWETLFKQVQASENGGVAPTVAASPIVQIFDNFYSFLFDVAPEVKPLFRSSMHVQGKALVRIIGAIKTMLADPNMVTRCAELAERHTKYGVKAAYFNALGVALLKTLEKCSLDGGWTKEVETAWRKVYIHIGLTVVEHLEKKEKASKNNGIFRFFQTSSSDSSDGRNSSNPSAAYAVPSEDAKCPMSGQKLSDMPGHEKKNKGKCPFHFLWCRK